MIRRITTLIACAVLFAACGGDDEGSKDSGAKDSGDQVETPSDPKAQEYADAIAATVQADEAAPFDDEQAQCLGAGMVDIIGVDALEEAGIEPADIEADQEGDSFDAIAQDLSEEQAGEIVDLIFDGDCFSFGEMIAAQMATDGPELSTEQATCVGDEFAKNEAFKQAFANMLLTGEEDPELDAAFSDILTIFETCEIDLTALGA